jgi:hypothetical protein
MEENKLVYEYDFNSVEDLLNQVSQELCGTKCEISHEDTNRFTITCNKTYTLEIYELDETIEVVYNQVK